MEQNQVCHGESLKPSSGHGGGTGWVAPGPGPGPLCECPSVRYFHGSLASPMDSVKRANH